jgi:hypothetical protein
MPMRHRPNHSMMLWTLTLAGCAAIVLLFSSDLLAQCQMCRTALTQSAEGQRWSRGIDAGILLLLAAPFAIAGGSLLVMYHAQALSVLRSLRARLVRRADGKAALVIPSPNNP